MEIEELRQHLQEKVIIIINEYYIDSYQLITVYRWGPLHLNILHWKQTSQENICDVQSM